MSPSDRTRSSSYMRWSKSHARITYHLASSGMPDRALSEFSVPWQELQITAKSFDGYPPLVTALAEKEGVPEGMIFSTLGTSLANHLILALLFDPGDEILIERPGYELLDATAAYLGAVVRPLPRRPETCYAVDADDVRRLCGPRTKAILLTNLHNPTSAFTSEERLAALARIAEERGIALIVDEVYLDAAFGMNARCAARISPAIITTNSLTKIYGLSGLRCGWVVAQPDVVGRLYRLNDLFEVNPPHLPEQISVIALQERQRMLDATRRILDENHAAFAAFAERVDAFEPFLPGFGTVVFSRFRNGSADRFVDFLAERYETSLAPGRFFGMPEYVRFGLTGDPAMVREGLARVEEAVRAFRA